MPACAYLEYVANVHTKERATVTLTSEMLRTARTLIPDLNLSALFDAALAERVREAQNALIASSYAEFPSDYDDDVDWASMFNVSPEDQARAMAARGPWKGDD